MERGGMEIFYDVFVHGDRTNEFLHIWSKVVRRMVWCGMMCCGVQVVWG